MPVFSGRIRHWRSQRRPKRGVGPSSVCGLQWLPTESERRGIQTGLIFAARPTADVSPGRFASRKDSMPHANSSDAETTCPKCSSQETKRTGTYDVDWNAVRPNECDLRVVSPAVVYRRHCQCGHWFAEPRPT
jgi:hypothetical protein